MPPGVATNRETEEGLERLRSVVKANPRSTTFVPLAHALCEAGLAAEAETVCREGLVQHPKLVTGQVALGRALLEDGRTREALDLLLEAAKSSPEHGDVFAWLGDAVLRRGDVGRACAILAYAEELLPNNPRVAELLVRAGGTPTARGSRLDTDFEHTRVSNARPLADRMHEDPPATNHTAPHVPAVAAPEQLGDDPTAVRSSGTVEGWLMAASAAGTAAQAPLPAGAPGALEPAPLPGASSPPLLGGTARDRWGAAIAGAKDLGAIAPVAAGAVGIVLLSVVLGLLRSPPRPMADAPPVSAAAPAPDLREAVAAGTVARLQQARATGKAVLAAPVDADQAAALAFALALLAADYGQSTTTEMNEAARVAEAAQPAVAVRAATIEAARALAALATGKLADARKLADRALAADPTSAAAATASARVRIAAGDLAQAAAELRAARTADFAPAVMAGATLALDRGDAVVAIAALRPLLAKQKDHLAARLLLAEAERAAGTRDEALSPREPCRLEARDTPTLRVHCALDAAAEARLAGDRAAAVKYARLAVAGVGRNVRSVAEGALLLALLGDIDAAAEALRKIHDETAAAYVPRAWAEAAITLGRGGKVAAGGLPATPNGPEARLVLARAAYAQGGVRALGGTLAQMGPAHVSADPELTALGALGRGSTLPAAERAALESRAEKGDPVAAYVLGRLALDAGSRKEAARRLAHALHGHGDTCEAARLLHGIDKALRPSSLAGSFKSVRARNAECPHVAP
jgi:tetratricopeptide (TPR) repeat protein